MLNRLMVRGPFQEAVNVSSAVSTAGATAEEQLGLCADSAGEGAWEEFIRRFHPVVVATALRTAQRYTPAYRELCNDLTQEVYLKFSACGARLLREFKPRHVGSAFGYVKIVTRNVVHDYFKGKGARRVDDILPDNLGAPDGMEKAMLVREIDDLLRKYARRTDREIFWMYYRHGMTAKEIALLPAVRLSVKGVESVLTRLAKLIRERFAPK